MDQYSDAESGLIYMRARYYDPATGQWLTRDPIAALSQVPHNYADNDPLNATDPSGLSSCGEFSLGGLVDCCAKAGT
jgi:RHS repeat-associated protein